MMTRMRTFFITRFPYLSCIGSVVSTVFFELGSQNKYTSNIEKLFGLRPRNITEDISLNPSLTVIKFFIILTQYTEFGPEGVVEETPAVFDVVNQAVSLIGAQHRDVQHPEQRLQEGEVHVPVVAVVDEASVSVLDHDEPEDDGGHRHVVPAGDPGGLEVLHGGADLRNQPLVVREGVREGVRELTD